MVKMPKIKKNPDELFPVFVKYAIAKNNVVLYNTERYDSVDLTESVKSKLRR